MTENKWRENLKETTRLITSQAFSLKITNLILELQYGLMVINFDRAHVHTHTRTLILSKLVKNYCLTEVTIHTFNRTLNSGLSTSLLDG